MGFRRACVKVLWCTSVASVRASIYSVNKAATMERGRARDLDQHKKTGVARMFWFVTSQRAMLERVKVTRSFL